MMEQRSHQQPKSRSCFVALREYRDASLFVDARAVPVGMASRILFVREICAIGDPRFSPADVSVRG